MAKSIRDAYGEALVEFGKNDTRVVVLDADVSSSTKSGLFYKTCPERFFNCGIAESNMAGIAAGFAATGKIPFVNTFAVFITSNGLNAIRTFGSYSELPVKIAGAYGGISDSFDGSTHHSLEDIAIMRALPNFKVFCPCDETQTRWLVKHAIDNPDPMYLRLARNEFPDVYKRGQSFEEGRAMIVREGKDATVIACGLMVSNALKAAEILERKNISIRVVDIFSIKPIDENMIEKCARETGAVITAEEHNIYGGLGSAVAEVLAKKGIGTKFTMVGVNDRHVGSGPYDTLQAYAGIDAYGVVNAVCKLVECN
ncbi:MAG: 1-deoxy-D-xylulose-5-phosphate synthase [Spirochaetales bacterium]|nr:1-deoxy-D-xylulose-5-phosphate synthase [Spirochaetales bacterium]